MNRANNHTGNSQNYNRYSYVLNNPLKYTDPSGYNPEFIDWSTRLGRPIKDDGLGEWTLGNNFSGGQQSHFPWYLQYNSPEFNRMIMSTRAYNELYSSKYGHWEDASRINDVDYDFGNGDVQLQEVEIYSKWVWTSVNQFGMGHNAPNGGGNWANGGLTFENQTAGAYAGELSVDSAGGGGLDWNTATDGQKIIHIMNGIRDARVSGGEYIDMRQLFSSFPKYGSGVNLIKGIKIGDNSMTVHMNLAIYKNMQIDIYPARMGQVGPFNGVNLNGVIKEGYWDMMELDRTGGNIPMLMIQINANFDAFYNYLYKN